MGVLVKGMNMPRHCGECGIDWCYIWRNLIWDETPIGTRPSDCPLVEVPTPHGRLIDADDFFSQCPELTAYEQVAKVVIEAEGET